MSDSILSVNAFKNIQFHCVPGVNARERSQVQLERHEGNSILGATEQQSRPAELGMEKSARDMVSKVTEGICQEKKNRTLL